MLVAPCISFGVRFERSNRGPLRVESAAEASDRLALRVHCPMEDADLHQKFFALHDTLARAISARGTSGGLATVSQAARTRVHSTDCAANATARAVARLVTSRASRPPLLPQTLEDAHL